MADTDIVFMAGARTAWAEYSGTPGFGRLADVSAVDLCAAAAKAALERAGVEPTQIGHTIVGNAMQGNNAAEAVKVLSDLIEEEPESIELLLARAMAYARTRVNVDEAIADVARIRELDPMASPQTQWSFLTDPGRFVYRAVPTERLVGQRAP